MINKIVIAVISLAIAASGLIGVPVFAATSSSISCPADLPNRELICASSAGGESKLINTVSNVLMAIYGIVGVLAVVMIVVGGVKYMTSQGDPGKIQSAKNTIMYSIIGLVIVLAAFAITNFILSALK